MAKWRAINRIRRKTEEKKIRRPEICQGFPNYSNSHRAAEFFPRLVITDKETLQASCSLLGFLRT